MREAKISKVFAVFSTDASMSVCSYRLMGLFGTIDKAVHAIVTKGEFDEDWLAEQKGDTLAYIKDFLIENLQTPNCGEINYVIKEGNLNEWEELL